MGIGPSSQNFTPRPLNRIPLIMLPNFQRYCLPLYSAPDSSSSQTQDPGGDALPLGSEVLGCTQESVGTLAGRPICPRAAGFKVRHLDPFSQTQAEPRQRQQQSGGIKAGQGSPASLLAPSPIYYRSPALIPPFYIRVWQTELWGSPSLPPPSHTHSPFFLKSPRSAGRWRPRNTTMTAGATQTSLPRPLRTPGANLARRDAGPAAGPSAQRQRPIQAEGRGCPPGPPPTFAAGPAPQVEFRGRNPLGLTG